MMPDPPTIVLHTKRLGCVVICYSLTIVQESERATSVNLKSKLKGVESVNKGDKSAMYAEGSKRNSPNACYIFPDLVSISALELTELGSLLNLEEYFIPRCATDLQNETPSSSAL
jgi:hypothetical protein